MKGITHHTVKSITRNALFISMILHVFFLVALFHFSLRDQSVLPFQDKVDASIETLKKTPLKKPIQTPIRRQFNANVHESAKTPMAKVESITPEMTFQSRVTSTPVVAEQPRLKHTNTAPDVEVNVSTAISELREVEHGLSKTEAAEPTVGSSLGSKRSGTHGIQRAPTRSTLNVAGTTNGYDDNPTNIGDLKNKKPPLPAISSFSNIMKTLASDIIDTSGGGPIDVVFVIDASGSMGDNIKAVAKHLIEMIDVYDSSGIDYALGLTEFHAPGKNIINVFQLTQNVSEYKENIRSIVPRKDENALDAIEETVREMRFRATSKKHLILVTDEPFTSLKGLKVGNVIGLCHEFGIYVNVLGLLDPEHQLLANETNGKWHLIPGRQRSFPIPKKVFTPNNARTPEAKAKLFRETIWQQAQMIGKALIQNVRNSPVDIILFIDGSKSMEDKLPYFFRELQLWTRDWDTALIDYQIAVVRFRAQDSVNMVNVFKPPQTLEQVRKILELPGQENENLLHAIPEGFRQIKLRRAAKTHLIIVTDEPLSEKTSASSIASTIHFLEKKFAVVSVIGTFDHFQQEVAHKTGGIWMPIPQGHLTNKEHY